MFHNHLLAGLAAAGVIAAVVLVAVVASSALGGRLDEVNWGFAGLAAAYSVVSLTVFWRYGVPDEPDR